MICLTEKRFTINSIGVFHDNFSPLHDDEVVELLNQLHEENEKLKKERDSLAQGMVNTAKDSADIITKVWESKHKIPTERIRYWE